MRKIYLTGLSVVMIWLFSGCEKVKTDMKDYYPVVKTVSATVLSDGSVEMKGEIVSEGTAPMGLAGFCVSTNPVPEMLDVQAIADINGNIFTATYTGFQLGTKYYFRSWAYNDNGYTYGNIISLDSIAAAYITSPCSPTMNTINIGSGITTINSVGSPNYLGTGWQFSVSTGSINMTITTRFKPVTKIYTTTASTSPDEGEINIYFYSGFITGNVKAGSPVYVNQTSANSWEMTICNAPWTNGTSTLYMTAKFISPL